jgi:hypothetical protein
MSWIFCPRCSEEIEIPDESQLELPGLLHSLKPLKENPEGNVKRLTFNASGEGFFNGSVERPSVERSILDELPLDPSSLICCDEETFLSSLSKIVGEFEIKSKGGLWRFLFRQDRRAMSYAFEDWKLLTPDQRREIKNRPAWLTDRFKRAHYELAKKSA